MIKTNTVLVDPKKMPLKNEKDEELTLGAIASSSLLFKDNEDQVKAYKLGNKFLQEEEFELSAEDVVFVKKALKKSTFTPVVVGQAIILIDPTEAL